MSTILVTGVNGNLGPSVVKRLLEDDFNVVGVIGKSGSKELPDDHRLETVQVDLMDETKTREFIKTLIEKAPPLQAAVLLVGGFAMGNIEDTSQSDLEKMIKLNFNTAYNVVRPLMSYFLGRPVGGQFILVGTRPAMDAGEGRNMFAYSLSKAMVFKLAEHINTEGKGNKVTATVVVPSTIDTESNRQAMPDADFSKWVAPGDLANTISFALSKTGTMLRETVIKVYNQS